jgi:putative hemolysin
VAVVHDEFGGVQGLATVDDIVDALVGDLPEPGDPGEPSIARRPDGSWLVDGAVPLEELEAELDVDPLPEEERRGFRTVAGLVITRLGRLPTTGEGIDVGGFRFTVAEMDGRRIAKVRVSHARANGGDS